MFKTINFNAALTVLGYWEDDFEGLIGTFVDDRVEFEDTEYGFGYDVVTGKCEAYEDVAYTDKFHQKWYLESVVVNDEGIAYANTWSAEKPDAVKQIPMSEYQNVMYDDEPDSYYEEEEPYLRMGIDYSPSAPWNAPGMSISDFI